MRILMTALLLTMLAGCRTEPKMQSSSNFPTRQTYNVPPKTLLEKVKSAVGIPIESEQDGRLVTSWQMHDGAKFGVGPVGRTWQERTRYTITIAPAWDDSNNKSTIEVTEETQQRPHDQYEWGSQEPVKRPELAAEMARKIDAALSSASK
ncbi:MAG: hypothetical protein H7Z14_05010 [Anaerolineae bacterium]|nr:hypothetical protein [Phycisphaerae bacterium]